MIDALAPAFVGPLADLRDRVLLAADAPEATVAACELFTPAGLARMIACHARNYPPGDSRAVLSLWSKYYLARIIYLSVGVGSYLGRALPMDLARLGLVPATTGEIDKLVLPNTGEPAPDTDAATSFRMLLDDNLEPAVAAMACYSGLSPRVYWSNAGHYLHYLAHTLADMPDGSSAAQEVAGLLTRRRLDDGRRNPLFGPIQDMTDAHGSVHAMRRVCCVQFRLPGVGYCGNCPLLVARPGRRRGMSSTASGLGHARSDAEPT